MACAQHTPAFASLEGAITVLFCLIDDAYRLLNPGADGYASLKKLSDSQVLTLALLQQLRGVESADPAVMCGTYGGTKAVRKTVALAGRRGAQDDDLSDARKARVCRPCFS